MKLKKTKKYNNNLARKNINKILKNAYDKPKLLTLIFLKFDLRFLTKYSSGYNSWYEFFEKFYIKTKIFVKDLIYSY